MISISKLRPYRQLQSNLVSVRLLSSPRARQLTWRLWIGNDLDTAAGAKKINAIAVAGVDHDPVMPRVEMLVECEVAIFVNIAESIARCLNIVVRSHSPLCLASNARMRFLMAVQ